MIVAKLLTRKPNNDGKASARRNNSNDATVGETIARADVKRTHVQQGARM
jgi:hypothetical protein